MYTWLRPRTLLHCKGHLFRRVSRYVTKHVPTTVLCARDKITHSTVVCESCTVQCSSRTVDRRAYGDDVARRLEVTLHTAVLYTSAML